MPRWPGYEARRDQNGTPERRTLEQALVGTRRPRPSPPLGGRRDFAAITAQAEAAGGSALEIGRATAPGCPSRNRRRRLRRAPGGVTEPVQSPFGWHVMKASRPARRRPALDQVRDELRTHRLEKAADLAFERANRLEDALSGGATVEEAAQRFGLGPPASRRIPPGNGRDGGGWSCRCGAARAAVLEAIFAAEGGGPRLADAAGGFVAHRPAGPPPPRR